MAATRRRAAAAAPAAAPEAPAPPPTASPATSPGGPPVLKAAGLAELAPHIALILVACCGNAWTVEAMLSESPRATTLISLFQYLFMAALLAPKHVQWPRPAGAAWRWVPQLRHVVPLRRWAWMVVLFFGSSMLTNTSLRFQITMPVLVVMRSASLPVSMLFGAFYFRRRYRLDQVLAVGLVTAGVLLVTAGTVHDNGGRAAAAAATVGLDSWRQLEAWIGIAMLVGAMFVSGYLGAVQETVFSEYGKLSDEAVFYLHFLGLPVFLLFWQDLAPVLVWCSQCERWPLWPASVAGVPLPAPVAVPRFWLLLAANMVTQYLCLRGVYGMASRTSNVTLNVALSVRKALSLFLSIWYFNNRFTVFHIAGAVLVFGGTLLYRDAGAAPPAPKAKAS